MKQLFKIIAPFLLFVSLQSLAQNEVLLYAHIDDFDEDLNAKFDDRLKSNLNKRRFKDLATFKIITKGVRELRSDSLLVDLLVKEQRPRFLILVGLISSETKTVIKKTPNPLIYSSSVNALVKAFAPPIERTKTIEKKKYFFQLFDLVKKVELNKQAILYDGGNLNYELSDYRHYLIKNKLLE